MVKAFLPRLLARLAPRLLDRRVARAFSTPRRIQRESASPDPLGGPRHVDHAGERIAVWSRGSGRAVLLVHGWEGSHRDLDLFAAELLGLGYRVVAVDFPGHGESSGGRLDIPTMAQLVDRLVDRECGSAPAMIVAHSLGGVAAFLALARRGRAVPLILLASPTRARTYLLNMLRALGLPEQRYESIRNEYRAMFGIDLDRLDVALDASSAASPTLLVYGDSDRLVPPSEGERYVELLADARLEILPGAGHRRILRDPRAVELALAFAATKGEGEAGQIRPAAE